MADQQSQTTIDERRAAILEQKLQDWPRRLRLAEDGNPFATLCRHCYGRHPPPNDEICPRDPPQTKEMDGAQQR